MLNKREVDQIREQIKLTQTISGDERARIMTVSEGKALIETIDLLIKAISTNDSVKYTHILKVWNGCKHDYWKRTNNVLQCEECGKLISIDQVELD